MSDETEGIRMALRDEIEREAPDLTTRAAVEKRHGQCWDTQELQRDFEVLGFMTPFCIVRRKSDGVKGSLMFQHHPRFYFCWLETTK